MICTLLRKPPTGGILQSLPVACLNIEESRIPTDDFVGMSADTFRGVKTGNGAWAHRQGHMGAGRRGGWLDGAPSGRFPANLLFLAPMNIPHQHRFWVDPSIA